MASFLEWDLSFRYCT